MGYGLDRFEDSVDPLLFCLRCKDVLNDPQLLEHPAGDYYVCKLCLSLFSKIQEFDRPPITPEDCFKEKYLKLKIKCMFFGTCKSFVPISDIDSHQILCIKNIGCKFLCLLIVDCFVVKSNIFVF